MTSTITDSVITATERRELRSAVRAEARAQRGAVKQRGKSLEAEVEARLIEKYRDDGKNIEVLRTKLRKLTEKSNRELRKLVEEFRETYPATYLERVYDFSVPSIYRGDARKENLRRALLAGMRAELGNASTAIDQQEADLLLALAQDALKSDAALTFMQRITKIQELLPVGKMAEIEARYDGTHTPTQTG